MFLNSYSSSLTAKKEKHYSTEKRSGEINLTLHYVTVDLPLMSGWKNIWEGL